MTTTTRIPLSAAGAVLVAMVVSALAAAAAAPPSSAPPMIGMPGCDTRCGNMSVPYPFGMGSSRCYHSPGFNLTCDRRSDPPRLLLGDGTLQVIEDIDMEFSSVFVRRTSDGDFEIDAEGNGHLGGGIFEPGSPYVLEDRNEFVLIGCNVQATLKMAVDNTTISSCSSVCYDVGTDFYVGDMSCRSRIVNRKAPSAYHVHLDWIGANTSDDKRWPMRVFVATTGWFEQNIISDKRVWKDQPAKDALAAPPVRLRWKVPFRQAGDNNMSNAPSLSDDDDDDYCLDDILSRNVCKSKHSWCFVGGDLRSCFCKLGYRGNPYIIDGCRDIDECNQPQDIKCYGSCTNTDGSFECHCPAGTQGNPALPGGCFSSTDLPGIVVLIGLASGAGVTLLVLLVLFISKQLKHRRAQMFKRKFFEKNRGKLLQQLVSRRADISERMIISLEELEKATNNFDKSRELGGGGHGTVYKGILSDLHVVAIKKPKKVLQEEIEEFINEVAILSQINHRNVVKLYGCCLETEVPMLVYEFISNGTLHDHLHVEEAKSLPWDDRQRIAIETAKSIAHLHSTTSTPIIHRDIKSVNILLDETLTAKVADFGASRYVPIDKSGLTTRVQGTIGYMDPMYFYTGRLTEKSDVFGFGVMLVELLTRQKPFHYMSSEGDGLVAHFSSLFAEGKLMEILDPQVMEEGGKEVEEVASLAVTCIKLAPKDRPTMRQVELEMESIQSSKKVRNVIAHNSEKAGSTINLSCIKDNGTIKECTRQYSMEQEFENSARYPR